MPYRADISRANPTAFLFILDQSGSMAEAWEGTRKAQGLADAVNRVIAELITLCSKEDGIRPYFHIGALGYGGDGVVTLLPADAHWLTSTEMEPLAEIEKRKGAISDGFGGIVEVERPVPTWIQIEASGGTPMLKALTAAAHLVAQWCDEHREAYPPTVIHITDGESTDGDPEPVAEILRQLATLDGEVLLFNLHLSSVKGVKSIFAASEEDLPSAAAQRLFRMSSPLPQPLAKSARDLGLAISEGARGYAYNADFVDLVRFLNIGTRPASVLR